MRIVHSLLRSFPSLCSSGAALFLLTASTLCAAATPRTYGFRVLHTYPHDPNAFTQGLIVLDGKFYESTGLFGQYSLRIDDPTTGRLLKKLDIPAHYFGEGLTDWKSKLVQLTWQSHVVFVYDRATLRQLYTLTWPREGWGLTHDAEHLILSDGTPTLYFLDPENMHEVRRITVTDDGKPVTNLNELEFVRGEIFANVWHQNRIARISPRTGEVVGWVDLTGLLSPMLQHGPEDVLNGIAYDPEHGRLFVTGKHWPAVFEIQIVPKSTAVH